MNRANWAFSKLRNDVYTYFKYCPLCFAEASMRLEFPSTIFGKIHMICSECGAKWHINYGKTVFDLRFKWAKLEKAGVGGKGNDLLNKKREPDFWLQKALKGRNILKKTRDKVQCPYCETLYDRQYDRCPKCGAYYQGKEAEKMI